MLPLAGIRVLDLTRILAGPFATMKLGDMGADVVKVEQPGMGDDTRGWGPPFLCGVSTYFLSVNRNKRSLTLDLKAADGKAILRRLVGWADVLVENFRPGTLERLGFEDSTLFEMNPRLVYASISGYGHESDYRDRPSYDLIVQGEAGVMDVTGLPDGPPTKVGLSIADEVAGMLACEGILLALFARERTGRGDRVDISLFDGMLSMLTYQSQMALSSESTPRRRGNEHPSIVPYETFRASDRFLNVGVGSERLWERFTGVIGCPDLRDDSRFRTNADRVAHRADLVTLLNETFGARPAEAWYVDLSGAGIPCGYVNTVSEACRMAREDRRGLIETLSHPEAGDFEVTANPVRLQSAAERPHKAPPLLGEHTHDVLRELGYGDAEIQSFQTSGAI